MQHLGDQMWTVEFPFTTKEAIEALNEDPSLSYNFILSGALKESQYCRNGLRKLVGYHNFFDIIEFWWVRNYPGSSAIKREELENILDLIADIHWLISREQIRNIQEGESIFDEYLEDICAARNTQSSILTFKNEAKKVWRFHLGLLQDLEAKVKQIANI
ncbi:hypothetical protein [Cognatishimia sp. F0-27]|uniref:hypothetical protein n=1 Tax=Cognatishimia sp. F0-27 TaxID=2816855 RepID=UPI001D0CD78E|nr:hypothetical protein [Cognatishimia sp. F0-27]MCC1495042.1 hypothetical protein [Cognatishimia sp. F0-27]